MNDLVVRITGKIEESNFNQWKNSIIKSINEINKDLKTDEDFIDATDKVKMFKQAEDNLKIKKEEALKQAEDIYKLFGGLDEVSDLLKSTRLNLNKQIKIKKEELKNDLLNEAFRTVDIYLKDTSKYLRFYKTDFYKTLVNSIKGKASIVKMNSTLLKLTDDLKIELERKNNLIRDSLDVINEVKEIHKHLVKNDIETLVNLSEEELIDEIQIRIKDFEIALYKQKEKDRIKKENDLRIEEEQARQKEILDKENLRVLNESSIEEEDNPFDDFEIETPIESLANGTPEKTIERSVPFVIEVNKDNIYRIESMSKGEKLKGEYEQDDCLMIKINGEVEFTISDRMEPEDANLNRELGCRWNIHNMLVEAFEAGKAGKILISSSVATDDEDEFERFDS